MALVFILPIADFLSLAVALAIRLVGIGYALIAIFTLAGPIYVIVASLQKTCPPPTDTAFVIINALEQHNQVFGSNNKNTTSITSMWYGVWSCVQDAMTDDPGWHERSQMVRFWIVLIILTGTIVFTIRLRVDRRAEIVRGIVSAALDSMRVAVATTTTIDDCGSGGSSSNCSGGGGGCTTCVVCFERLDSMPSSEEQREQQQHHHHSPIADGVGFVVQGASCRHVFHQHCISHWLLMSRRHSKCHDFTCPVCHQNFLDPETIRTLTVADPVVMVVRQLLFCPMEHSLPEGGSFRC